MQWNRIQVAGTLIAVSVVSSYSVLLASVLLISYILTFHQRRLVLFWRDLCLLQGVIPGGVELLRLSRKGRGEFSSVDIWVEAAAKYGSKPNLFFEDQEFTFEDVDRMSNRVANWGLKIGLQQGDAVAIDVTNSPEFIFLFIGFLKIGVVSSLINTNISGCGLAHCLSISGAKIVVFCSDTAKNVQDLVDCPEGKDISFFHVVVKGLSSSSQDPFATSVDIETFSADPVPKSARSLVRPTDLACCIYTSGTTGFPKAAKVSHFRLLSAAIGMKGLVGIVPNDRMYNVLPLYHSSGLIVGYITSWRFGNAVVIRKKFSASKFFEECCKYKATHVLYIGELLRYLCNTPATAYDTKHSIRLCVGNGLRPEVWTKFVDRFKVPRIFEFYGATEGNCTLVNTMNKVGAMGFLSRFMQLALPIRVIKIDLETEEPLRGKNGLCIECARNEPGQLIGRIEDRNPTRHFDGYSDENASKKKILTDVFTKGDRFFLTGDLVVVDDDDYVYFKDRIGDTFRWKGENCSTAEVGTVFSSVPQNMIQEAVVYGMSVPGYDGKCGMCLVTKSPNFDVHRVYEHVSKSLPSYAVPVFLRVTENEKEVEVTGTFKHRRITLVQEGFDPSCISDSLYYKNNVEKTYSRLTSEMYEKILDGHVCL